LLAVIAPRVVADVRSGSVILLHDGDGDRSQTVTALPKILKTLKARGYVFYPLRGQ
jgi:peptidoglycan/xylan/chitin deacetylase (PgdA/CDA1 family)